MFNYADTEYTRDANELRRIQAFKTIMRRYPNYKEYVEIGGQMSKDIFYKYRKIDGRTDTFRKTYQVTRGGFVLYFGTITSVAQYLKVSPKTIMNATSREYIRGDLKVSVVDVSSQKDRINELYSQIKLVKNS